MNELLARDPCTAARDAKEQDDTEALLGEVCQAPGCYLPNGEHSAEETTACLERWLAAQDDGAPRR
jgi:hypothetical protein